MKNLKMLTIGDKVTLSRVAENEEYRINRTEDEVKFPSKLVDIVSDEILVVTVPYVNNNYLKMLKNQEFKISIYTKTTILQAQVLVMNIYKESNLSLASLHLQSSLRQYQRRKFYRMPCTITMDYRETSPLEEMLLKRITEEENAPITKSSKNSRTGLLSKEENNAIIEMCKDTLFQLQRYRYSGIISDLSGGGIRFHSAERHNLYDKFKVKFHMFEDLSGDAMELDVCIIDQKKLSNVPPQFEYRANFVSITEKDREKIIRGIFKIECENRRRK